MSVKTVDPTPMSSGLVGNTLSNFIATRTMFFEDFMIINDFSGGLLPYIRGLKSFLPNPVRSPRKTISRFAVGTVLLLQLQLLFLGSEFRGSGAEELTEQWERRMI